MPHHLVHGGAVVWARDYSDRKPANCKCEALAEVLKAMPHPAERMVMGHTIQRGINAACEGKALRVDVGMSSGCRDARPEVRMRRGIARARHTPHARPFCSTTTQREGRRYLSRSVADAV